MRRQTNLGAVLVLDLELVLEHDHVPLALLVLHLGLERRAQRVEEVAARRDGLGREEADPAQARDDALLFRGGGERDEGGDAGEERAANKSEAQCSQLCDVPWRAK